MPIHHKYATFIPEISLSDGLVVYLHVEFNIKN